MANFNKVDRVLIGGGTDSGATTIPALGKGDLVLVRENGTVIKTAANAALIPKLEKVKIAMGLGNGNVVFSSPIQGNTVAKYTGTPYAAETVEVLTLGYNGTSGTIAVQADTEYRLRVNVKDYFKPFVQRPTFYDVNYVSSSSATVYEVMDGITKMYYQTDYGTNAIKGKVTLDRLVVGTFTAFAVITTNVVKDSKLVVTSAANTVAVGDVLRIGGTASTVPYYVVTKVISTTQFEIDIPYQGATATIAPANIGKMTVPTAYGLRLTGVKQEPMVNLSSNSFYGKYEWVNFDASFTTADDTDANPYSALKTILTTAFPGQGEWKEVSYVEEKAKGYLGDTDKRNWYAKRIESNVDKTKNYGAIQIEHYDIIQGSFQNHVDTPLMTQIFVPAGSNQGLNTGDNFLAILNAYFGTVLGFTAIPTL